MARVKFNINPTTYGEIVVVGKQIRIFVDCQDDDRAREIAAKIAESR